jgi:hypothetical protein
MSVGKHSSSEVTVSLEDAQEGTPRLVTAFILTISAVKITSIMQKSTAFGDTWDKMLPTGLMKADPITLTGFWDDSAGGTAPHTVFLTPDTNPNSGTRALVVTFSTGTVRTFTIETLLESYAVIGKNSLLTEFAAVLVPTGTGTWS